MVAVQFVMSLTMQAATPRHPSVWPETMAVNVSPVVLTLIVMKWVQANAWLENARPAT
jgi:hypothetical protein